MPKASGALVTLKVWDNWSDGIGYARDERGVNGVYFANAIIGLKGELRPAPVLTARAQTHAAGLTVAGNIYHAIYFFEEAPTTPSAATKRAYLYAMMSTPNPINSAEIDNGIIKIPLENTIYGDSTQGTGNGLQAGVGALATDDPWGQPAKYQNTNVTGTSSWYLTHGSASGAATTDTRELTTVGYNAADTWNGTAKTEAQSADHYVNLNFQVSRTRRTQGAAILVKDQNLRTGTWGSTFECGDKNDRALGITTLAGANFALMQQGLYSYNESGKSGQVFDDFRDWRLTMIHATLKPYKSGLLIAHPSGLYWYTPGNPPVNIGPDAFDSMSSIEPPGGPSDTPGVSLQNGRYHGAAVVGDFVYVLFQPKLTSTTLLIFWGAPRKGDPTNIAWQCIGQTTMSGGSNTSAAFPLLANAHFTACFVSTLGYPESATNASPVLWVGDAGTATSLGLRSMNLDNRGTPLRSRAETHGVALSGDAWLSELYFPDPIDLEELVVVTQDMTSGDEWRFSLITDGRDWASGDTDTDPYVAAQVKSNGRWVLPIRRHDVHRVMLHVNWTTTVAVTTLRVVPVIKRIELRGRP